VDPPLTFEDDSSWVVLVSSRTGLLVDSQISAEYVTFSGNPVPADSEYVPGYPIPRAEAITLVTTTTPGGTQTAPIDLTPENGIPDGIYCREFVARSISVENGRQRTYGRLFVYFQVLDGIAYRLTMKEYSSYFEETEQIRDTDGVARTVVAGTSWPALETTGSIPASTQPLELAVGGDVDDRSERDED